MKGMPEPVGHPRRAMLPDSRMHNRCPGPHSKGRAFQPFGVAPDSSAYRVPSARLVRTAGARCSLLDPTRFRDGSSRGTTCLAALAVVLLNIGVWLVAVAPLVDVPFNLQLAGRILELCAATAFMWHAFPRVRALR